LHFPLLHPHEGNFGLVVKLALQAAFPELAFINDLALIIACLMADWHNAQRTWPLV
jgi:hypothetical protein